VRVDADARSALYLGLRHLTGSLRPRAQLTTGRATVLAGSEAIVRRSIKKSDIDHAVDEIGARNQKSRR